MAVTADCLVETITRKQGVITQFGGNTVLLHADGVVFSPVHDTLLVSDLHFEKGSYLLQSGNPLAPLDTYATLQRLTRLVHLFNPARVICLGDSFHDRGAFNRLSTNDRQLMTELIAQTDEWVWVLGNHDPDLPDDIPGDKCHHLRLGKVLVVHEPEKTIAPQIVGHFHPKGRLMLNRQRLTGKCFVVTDSLMILPAFGQYTGGLDINDAAIIKRAPKSGRRCYFLYEKLIYPLNERGQSR